MNELARRYKFNVVRVIDDAEVMGINPTTRGFEMSGYIKDCHYELEGVEFE